jgi:hypothetical protein
MSDPFVPANAFWRCVLTLCRTPALTMPWRTVYYLPEVRKPTLHWMDIRLHEDVHIEQIDRMGGTTFALVYIWQLIRYGYWNAPLEIEARAAHE